MTKEAIEQIAEEHSIKDLGRISPAYECGFTQGANYMKGVMTPKIDKALEDGELLAYNCEKKGRTEVLEKVKSVLYNALEIGDIECKDIEKLIKAIEK